MPVCTLLREGQSKGACVSQARAPLVATNDGEFGRDEQHGKHYRMFLGEERDGEEQEDEGGIPAGEATRQTSPEVDAHRECETERDDELRLTDDVAGDFDVDGMDGEQRAGGEGCSLREDGGNTPAHRERGGNGEENVAEMEDPRRAMTGDPLERKQGHDDGSIAVGAEGGRPVRLPPQGAESAQLMDQAISENDVAVVVGEVVPEAGDRRRECQQCHGKRGQVSAQRRHRRTVNLMMCHSAATPSRQLIFLPSA
jgi:hypothetical protein